MKKYLNLFRSRLNGFSRTETIIVISILALLATSVLINLTAPVQAGQITAGSIPERKSIGNVNLDTSPSDLQTENPGTDWQQTRIAANQAARRIELKIVQTAVDTMMIKEGLSSVLSTKATDDMNAFPSGTPLYPRYLRDQTTSHKYTCDQTGQVKLAE